MANPDSGVKFQEDIKDNPSTTPTPYQIQEFNESDYKSRILDSQFNSGKSKRDQRRFNKYINSDEGKKAMLVDTKPTAPAKIPWTHSVKPATAPANVTFDWDTFVSANGLKTETVDGKKYALYDPWGMGEFKIDQNGHVYDHRNGLGWVKSTDDNLDITPKTSAYWDKGNYKELMSMISRYIQRNKQGGTMNRIKYFQQGGAAPQQDMQQQVVALVQAAMQGDEKATQTVNKIMEAAKAGDQQAAQIAQMIQQVVQQMKGQATAAKWGAKLGYIRSLKFANGGKACPACQAGAPIQKVEEKACGGKAKKAKKRYFGGWL